MPSNEMTSKAPSNQAAETELAARVIAWLEAQHWEVYQEVRPGLRGDAADIVAVRRPLLWVIECKCSFSLDVIAQAHRWKALLRSVAVPRSRLKTKSSMNKRNRAFALDVCRQFQIGVLEVGKAGIVYETVRAPILRQYRESSRRIEKRLSPVHKTFLPAGTQSGARWTPYRETMDRVKLIVGNQPGCTLREIMQRLKNHHYHTDATARSAVARALLEWEDWCFVDESRSPRRYYPYGEHPTDAEDPLFNGVDDNIEVEAVDAGASATTLPSSLVHKSATT